ncbi:MAG TPA: WcaI family glycosyltransferase [Chloroflexota bacterium]|nr:WcaI family glycosyltransferase [Chloroflexota bacterium]
MGKRILFFARNFPPEQTGIGPLSGELCAMLAQHGCHVRVVAAPPHYPEWRVQVDYRRAFLPVERHGRVRVQRVPIILTGKPTGARARIVYDLSFALGAFWQGIRSRRVDVVVSVAPPVLAGLAGVLVACRHRAPLVLIVQDLELALAAQLGMLQSGWAVRVARWIERRVFTSAMAISAISDSFGTYLHVNGVPRQRIHVIPNWVDTDFIRPYARDTLLAERCGFPASAPVALYAGNLGEKQGLDILVRAAPLLRDRGIQIVLMGDGSARQRLETLAHAIAATNVHFLALQPRADLPRLLVSADIMVLLQRAEVVDSVAPSKLLAYMASGRPVVAAVNAASEAAHHVREADCGIVLPPGDSIALAQAIADLCAQPMQREAWGRHARHYAERNFSRAEVLERYRQLITQAQ